MPATRNSSRASKSAGEKRPAAGNCLPHQHVAASAARLAKQRLASDGFTEPAQEAFRRTVELLSAADQKTVAKQLGYESFEMLLKDSTVVSLEDGPAWCLTPDRTGTWTAWTVYSMELPPGFAAEKQPTPEEGPKQGGQET